MHRIIGMIQNDMILTKLYIQGRIHNLGAPEPELGEGSYKQKKRVIRGKCSPQSRNRLKKEYKQKNKKNRSLIFKKFSRNYLFSKMAEARLPSCHSIICSIGTNGTYLYCLIKYDIILALVYIILYYVIYLGSINIIKQIWYIHYHSGWRMKDVRR